MNKYIFFIYQNITYPLKLQTLPEYKDVDSKEFHDSNICFGMYICICNFVSYMP